LCFHTGSGGRFRGGLELGVEEVLETVRLLASKPTMAATMHDRDDGADEAPLRRPNSTPARERPLQFPTGPSPPLRRTGCGVQCLRPRPLRHRPLSRGQSSPRYFPTGCSGLEPRRRSPGRAWVGRRFSSFRFSGWGSSTRHSSV